MPIRQRKVVVAVAVVLAVAAAVATPRAVWAWGCEGHMIVARIAGWHLTPAAAKKTADLLAQSKIDPHLDRFCGHGDWDALVDGSTWPDDVREDRPYTSSWHFLDIPRDATADDVTSFCPAKGCVTKAIATQLGVLRSSSKSAKQKAEALRFLVHFVGDVHQPMHDVTNGDRGGNCVPVTYLGRTPEPGDKGKYTPNLHQMWDSTIIKTELFARDLTPFELAARIDCRFESQIEGWLQSPGTPADWAREGHQKARELGYGKLSPAVPVQEPVELTSCAQGNASKKMLDLHLVADQAYQDAAFAVINEQLAKAGARLAALLNEIWP